ncbi:MAG: hypothetical protein LC650_04800 [Actinobacteria bacterium]|nr:hypothetical protein [Actinomycetota bacterium]
MDDADLRTQLLTYLASLGADSSGEKFPEVWANLSLSELVDRVNHHESVRANGRKRKCKQGGPGKTASRTTLSNPTMTTATSDMFYPIEEALDTPGFVALTRTNHRFRDWAIKNNIWQKRVNRVTGSDAYELPPDRNPYWSLRAWELAHMTAWPPRPRSYVFKKAERDPEAIILSWPGNSRQDDTSEAMNTISMALEWVLGIRGARSRRSVGGGGDRSTRTRTPYDRLREELTAILFGGGERQRLFSDYAMVWVESREKAQDTAIDLIYTLLKHGYWPMTGSRAGGVRLSASLPKEEKAGSGPRRSAIHAGSRMVSANTMFSGGESWWSQLLNLSNRLGQRNNNNNNNNNENNNNENENDQEGANSDSESEESNKEEEEESDASKASMSNIPTDIFYEVEKLLSTKDFVNLTRTLPRFKRWVIANNVWEWRINRITNDQIVLEPGVNPYWALRAWELSRGFENPNVPGALIDLDSDLDFKKKGVNQDQNLAINVADFGDNLYGNRDASMVMVQLFFFGPIPQNEKQKIGEGFQMIEPKFKPLTMTNQDFWIANIPKDEILDLLGNLIYFLYSLGYRSYKNTVMYRAKVDQGLIRVSEAAPGPRPPRSFHV